MLRTAILGTVAQILAGLARIDPGEVIAVRNQVRFSCKLRNPEAVNYIRALQRKVRVDTAIRRGRNVNFIGRSNVVIGVVNFPPPLMADERDCVNVAFFGLAFSTEAMTRAETPIRMKTMRIGITVQATSI